MTPFVLSVAELREIYGAKAAHLTDAEVADLAKRLSEIAYLTLGVVARQASTGDRRAR